MPTSPDTDLVTLIDGQIATLTSGTNLFRGKRRPVGTNVPAEAVFCLIDGGPPTQAYADSTAIEQRHSAVQVSVRSDKDDYAGGLTLARQVRDAVNHATVVDYIDIRIGASEPNYIGEEDPGYHLWTINVEMWHEQ